jgi:hypothetical protein
MNSKSARIELYRARKVIRNGQILKDRGDNVKELEELVVLDENGWTKYYYLPGERKDSLFAGVDISFLWERRNEL